jgi:cell division protein FtsL
MINEDYIALGAFLLSLILALSAFIYWLISVSYKVNKFIFEVEDSIKEIKEHSKRYDNLVAALSKKVDHLRNIIAIEYPQHFKKQ